MLSFPGSHCSNLHRCPSSSSNPEVLLESHSFGQSKNVMILGNNWEWGLTAPFLDCGNYLEEIPSWKTTHSFLLSYIHSRLSWSKVCG